MRKVSSRRIVGIIFFKPVVERLGFFFVWGVIGHLFLLSVAG